MDAEFAKSVGLPGVILHGLYSMAQVARAHTDAAGGDPRALKRLSVQFRGMGFPEQEIVVTRRSRRPRRPRGHGDRGRPGRQPDHPERRGELERRRVSALRAAADAVPRLLRTLGLLDALRTPAADPSLVVDSYLESGKPVGSKSIAERAEVEWGASTVRAELAELERAGYLDPPAHLGRAGSHRRRLPLLRRFPARVRARARPPPGRGRPDPDAARGRRGDA